MIFTLDGGLILATEPAPPDRPQTAGFRQVLRFERWCIVVTWEVRFPSKENGDWRRISVRRWKAQCKAAIQRGDDPPPNPRTQGWLTW